MFTTGVMKTVLSVHSLNSELPIYPTVHRETVFRKHTVSKEIVAVFLHHPFPTKVRIYGEKFLDAVKLTCSVLFTLHDDTKNKGLVKRYDRKERLNKLYILIISK